MKGKKDIAILFFVIAVLVFYISSQKSEKTNYELPDIRKIQTGDITKISLKKKGSGIVLARENDKWLINDRKYPADNAVIENMLNAISDLTLTALASESGNYAIYELDREKRIEVEAYKGSDLLRKINVGKITTTYNQTFVMLDNDPRVYHASGALRREFDRTVSELRDKKVMAFNKDDITEVVLKKGKDEITIIRATAPVSVDVPEQKGKKEKPGSVPEWTTSDGKTVKKDVVNGIINILSGFLCDEFIEDKTKEDFKAPVFTVVLKGINTYTISFFEKRENRYPAVSSESEYPFLVSEWKANKIMKKPGSLIEKYEK
ncbi:MAG TPA: DUF4340 domain-containing protein [Nitrospirae bacterium]|nr:hypothetical protein BMS3Abin06_02629 [bacterium BMS3Abin06]HDH13006.1 DUF4340 domain-containing protein [Nitrospirota bacterium]HDZ02930.1 DUF4340 domain-containing protein [Nitrospirota bacterium]